MRSFKMVHKIQEVFQTTTTNVSRRLQSTNQHTRRQSIMALNPPHCLSHNENHILLRTNWKRFQGWTDAMEMDEKLRRIGLLFDGSNASRSPTTLVVECRPRNFDEGWHVKHYFFNQQLLRSFSFFQQNTEKMKSRNVIRKNYRYQYRRHESPPHG